MILFFVIVFTVYFSVNAYVFFHGLRAIPAGTGLRTVYCVVFLFFALAFIAGRMLERVWLSGPSTFLVWIGSFWLAALLYFVLAALAIDLARLANRLVPFFPPWVMSESGAGRIAVAVLALVIPLVIAGHLNALYPRVHKITLQIAKTAPGLKTMRLVMASDIHLGTVIGKSRFDRMVETINGLDPDLVVLAGDIVDEDLGPVIKQNLGETLRAIKARNGVYGITGNHEYIGGVEEATAYLVEHGVRMLRDSTVTVNDALVLVGREDRSISQFVGKQRRPLEDLLRGVDRRKAVVLLDHQPFQLEEGAKAGVDLQLSGHTHHGQLWPFNYITRKVYENSWGYLAKGNTHIYVSSGIGTWGPPVRLGNRPETVELTLVFAGP
jgi:predicted MPP superfamily phosphohydrolase